MLDDLLVLLGDACLTARLPKGPRSLWAFAIHLKIVVPQKLTAAEQELFEKLAAISSFRAREAMTGGNR